MSSPTIDTAYVQEVLRWMKRPRLICICNEFTLTGEREMEMDWHRCLCRGWVSAVRIYESSSRVIEEAEHVRK